MARAEQLDPKQRGLWAAYGAFYLSSNEPQEGIEALQKEIRYHPSDLFAYRILAKAQRLIETQVGRIETLKDALKVMPADVEIASDLSKLLVEEKRYAEVPGVLQPAIEKSSNQSLQGLLADALLRSGNRKEALAALEKYTRSDDPLALNNAAFSLADTNSDLPLAREYAETAVSKLEEQSNQLMLPSPTDAELVPGLPKQEASAEFFLLFSSGKLENIQFINGSESLREAASALKTADLHTPTPDGRREKILRRGVLSCPSYITPSCHFVMFLPSTSTSSVPDLQETGSDRNKPRSDIQQPTLLTKQDPQYSQAALQARVEGKVILALIVDENGMPQDITVVNPLGFGLDEAAKDCVARWRFRPGTKDGTAVKTPASVEGAFRLAKDYH